MAKKQPVKSKDVSELMNKMKAVEAGHALDLSSDEDLSIAVMNLISIEEHLFFTANKTENAAYYDILFEVREMRKELLKMLIKEYEGEVWCISKHLLAASMRVMEVGTKALTAGDKKRAENLFAKAWDLYNLFWALNLKMVEKKTVTELAKAEQAELKAIEKEDEWVEDGGGEACSVEGRMEVKKMEAEVKAKGDEVTGRKGWLKKFGKTMAKALDCCRE